MPEYANGDVDSTAATCTLHYSIAASGLLSRHITLYHLRYVTPMFMLLTLDFVLTIVNLMKHGRQRQLAVTVDYLNKHEGVVSI